MRTSAKLNATGYRWITDLANFHFEIKYRKVVMNKSADFLSRMQRNIDSVIKDCNGHFSPLEIISAMSSIFAQTRGSNNWISSTTADATVENFMNPSGTFLRAMDRNNLRQAQKYDPIIGRALDFKH